MKNSFLKKLALGMAAVMVVGSLSACGGNGDTSSEASSDAATSDAATEASSEPAAEADDKVLVVATDDLSSKFSTFFAQTAPDVEISDMTQVYLYGTDREGNPVLNGIEGETRSYNGTDYTYTGIADVTVTQNEDGSVTYDYTMRDDIVFSDGTPATIDDAIFSLYVLADPTYDGSSTIYAVPIVGMDEYRSGMEQLAQMLMAAGPDNTDFTYWTQEEQDTFWGAMDEAGALFAQDIVDYCLAAGYSGEDFGGSDVAMGMALWGFDADEDPDTVTGPSGTVYQAADVTTADYWNEILTAYDNDIQTATDTEVANKDIYSCVYEVVGEEAAANLQKGISTGSGADNISGVVKTGDYSMTITTSSYDATAIYNLALPIAPMHYYGDASLYDYDNNMFGFNKGDLSSVKARNAEPMGAGPYVFKSYENGVVTFTANASYFKGEPKIETVLFQETSDGDKLSGVVSGSFDVAVPSMSQDVLANIKKENSNGEIEGDILTLKLVDYRGYGYIGINANNVKVGDDQASDASKDLRKAIATVLAVYRDTVINSYYGEMAAVIQYPISNTNWAAPKPADEGYEIAYSTDVDGNPIYSADMTEEQKYEAALNAAVGFLKAAGYTYDEASGMFTAAPDGGEMTYAIMIGGGGSGDHPSYGILTAAKEALGSIGITLEINDVSDANQIWDANNAGTNTLWCAAWNSTPDPDMYQVYYSENVVENAAGSKSNNYHVQDDQLDELILAARQSADQAYRKATYKQCLDIIKDWAVEVPIYQRQDGYIISSERVNTSTLPTDLTPYWGWSAEIETLEMN